MTRKKLRNKYLSKSFIFANIVSRLKARKLRQDVLCVFLVSFSLVHNFSLVSPIVLFQIGLWWSFSCFFIISFVFSFNFLHSTHILCLSFIVVTHHTHYCIVIMVLIYSHKFKLLQSIC